MSFADLAEFALTALARHRLRTGLSLLGVAIGVAAVVLLTSLGEGARRFVNDQFGRLGSNLLVVIPGKNETTGFPAPGGVPNDLTLDDVQALQRGVRNARLIAPISLGNENVAFRERRRRATVIGTVPAFAQVRELRVSQGEFLPPAELDRGAQVVVLGRTVAEELFRQQPAVGRAVRIGDWRMRVIGVMEAVGTQIGLDVDELAVVPVATGMRMFNQSSLFRILVKTHSHADVDAACARALAILTERHDEEDVTCITQDSVASALSSILTALTLAIGGIGAISLSVAGIGIMNVMLVSVSERTEEVGLLKAVGARNRQILAVFLAEAVLIAVLGGLLGLSLGWLGVRVLAWLYPAFPAATPLWAAAAALATSIVAGTLFGVLPARRATRLDPIAALAGR